jgi:hypothetical protein
MIKYNICVQRIVAYYFLLSSIINYNFCAALSSFFAAIAAMWAAEQTRRSANAANESINLTKDNIKRMETIERAQSRAYIAYVGVKGDNEITALKPLIMTFIIKNVGVTPAYNVQTACVINSTSDAPTETEIDLLMVEKVFCGSLAPSILHEIEIPTDKDGAYYTPTFDQVQNIYTNKDYFCICVLITYDDIYGEHHETKICQRYYSDEHKFHSAPFYNSM